MTLPSKPMDDFRNLLLKNLPASAQRRLRKFLKDVTLSQRDSLHEPGRAMQYVYFPETAMVSLLTVMENGTQTEVASVGCEGMVGLTAFLGARKSMRRMNRRGLEKAACECYGIVRAAFDRLIAR